MSILKQVPNELKQRVVKRYENDCSTLDFMEFLESEDIIDNAYDTCESLKDYNDEEDLDYYDYNEERFTEFFNDIGISEEDFEKYFEEE